MPVNPLDVTEHSTLDHSTVTGVGEDNPTQVSGGERTAGSEAALRSFSPLDVATMAALHGAPDDGVTESVTNAPGAGTNISRTIPGSTLDTNNASLAFEVWGIESSVGDTVTVTLGSTPIFTMPITNSSTPFVIRGTILRTGASLAISCVFGYQQTVTSPKVQRTDSIPEDLTTALNLTVAQTGSCTFDALIIRKWAP